MRPMTMALRTRQYGAKGGEAGREATVRLGITRRKRRACVTFLVPMISFCLAGCP